MENLLDDVANKIIYIETSRGCPFKCGYCMASLDNKLRFFDTEIKIFCTKRNPLHIFASCIIFFQTKLKKKIEVNAQAYCIFF